MGILLVGKFPKPSEKMEKRRGYNRKKTSYPVKALCVRRTVGKYTQLKTNSKRLWISQWSMTLQSMNSCRQFLMKYIRRVNRPPPRWKIWKRNCPTYPFWWKTYPHTNRQRRYLQSTKRQRIKKNSRGEWKQYHHSRSRRNGQGKHNDKNYKQILTNIEFCTILI